MGGIGQTHPFCTAESMVYKHEGRGSNASAACSFEIHGKKIWAFVSFHRKEI